MAAMMCLLQRSQVGVRLQRVPRGVLGWAGRRRQVQDWPSWQSDVTRVPGVKWSRPRHRDGGRGRRGHDQVALQRIEDRQHDRAGGLAQPRRHRVQRRCSRAPRPSGRSRFAGRCRPPRLPPRMAPARSAGTAGSRQPPAPQSRTECVRDAMDAHAARSRWSAWPGGPAPRPGLSSGADGSWRARLSHAARARVACSRRPARTAASASRSRA